MKTLFNTVAVGALFTGIACLASPTQATPVLELEFDTGNHASLFPAGSDSMRIHYDNTRGPDGVGSPDGTTKQITVAAGMFSGVAVEEGSTVDIKTLFESAENVLAYCIDILQFLEASADYQVEDVPQTIYTDNNVQRNFGRMLSFLGAVNQVQQNKFGFTPDSRNWLRPIVDGGWMSGAIQLGIWESLYELSTNDLSVRLADDNTQWFWADVGGANSRTNVDPLGLAFLDDVFDLVNTGGDFAPVSETEVLWARNSTGQDLLIDPVDVPVPATAFLLLGGLGALAWRRRR